MPNTAQIADILFKKGLGIGTTQSGRLFFEEPIKGRPFVIPNQIWQQANQIPSEVFGPHITQGVIQRVDSYQLTGVVGTTNSYSGALLVDAIPFNWAVTGTGYNYALTDINGTAIAFGVGDWTIDTEAGILMFNATGAQPSNMPPKISFYRYSGLKGLPSTGSFNGLTGSINVTGVGDITTSIIGQTIYVSGVTGYVRASDTGSFITTGQTGSFGGGGNTGSLTGVFYPLIGNPSGFINSLLNLGSGFAIGSGIYNSILKLYSISGGTGISLSLVDGQILINVQSGNQNIPCVFNAFTVPSGETLTGFIPFNYTFNSTPKVIGSFINNSGDPIILYNISGISTTGFYLACSDTLTTNNYIFEYLATTGNGVINLGNGLSVVGGFGSADTGTLTGAFYPLNSNPSGYLTSASSADQIYLQCRFLV